MDFLIEQLEKRDFVAKPLEIGWYNEEREKIIASGLSLQLIETDSERHRDRGAHCINPPRGGFWNIPDAAAADADADCCPSFGNDSLAVIVGTNARFFESQVLPRLAACARAEGFVPRDFVEKKSRFVTLAARRALEEALPAWFNERVFHSNVNSAGEPTSTKDEPTTAACRVCHLWDLDSPPYIHAQTLGHVATLTEHVEVEHVEDLSWTEGFRRDIVGSGNRVLGFSVHPEFGGWYAFRYLITFPYWQAGAARQPSAALRPAPLKFCDDQQRKRGLESFNFDFEAAHWRDIVSCRTRCSTRYEDPEAKGARDCPLPSTGQRRPCSCNPIARYSPEAFLYFHTKSISTRRRYIELALSRLLLDVPARAIVEKHTNRPNEDA